MIFKQAEHIAIEQLVSAINIRTDIRTRKTGWHTRTSYP